MNQTNLKNIALFLHFSTHNTHGLETAMQDRKWQQTTQRQVKSATATVKILNTIVKYQQQHGFLFNNKTMGFEIQTRKMHKPF